jgi:hypothetical protein
MVDVDGVLLRLTAFVLRWCFPPAASDGLNGVGESPLWLFRIAWLQMRLVGVVWTSVSQQAVSDPIEYYDGPGRTDQIANFSDYDIHVVPLTSFIVQEPKELKSKNRLRGLLAVLKFQGKAPILIKVEWI